MVEAVQPRRLYLKTNADVRRVGVIFLMTGPGRESRAFFIR